VLLKEIQDIYFEGICFILFINFDYVIITTLLLVTISLKGSPNKLIFLGLEAFNFFFPFVFY